ncbi:hypothetical protein M8J76_008126 [Diaphorina citri]|nr:hypothetical protein M8J76_008126 [Diaphorina citri]
MKYPNQDVGSQKTVHVLHNSEQPASVFSILESGVPGGPGGPSGAVKNIPVVADSLFDLLMMKMTPVYTSKKQTKGRGLSWVTFASNSGVSVLVRTSRRCWWRLNTAPV